MSQEAANTVPGQMELPVTLSDGQKDTLLKHAATLLRASRYALKKPAMDHAGYLDSVGKLIAVIEGHCDAPSGPNGTEEQPMPPVPRNPPAPSSIVEQEKWTFDRDQPIDRRDRRIYVWPRHIGNAVSISDARALCDEHNASIERAVKQQKET